MADVLFPYARPGCVCGVASRVEVRVLQTRAEEGVYPPTSPLPSAPKRRGTATTQEGSGTPTVRASRGRPGSSPPARCMDSVCPLAKLLEKCTLSRHVDQ
jgi:hypothetical protein